MSRVENRYANIAIRLYMIPSSQFSAKLATEENFDMKVVVSNDIFCAYRREEVFDKQFKVDYYPYWGLVFFFRLNSAFKHKTFSFANMM